MNGLIVGFTSSLPLLLIVGPVSLMVLDTGLTTGVRGGWPAPLGVAGAALGPGWVLGIVSASVLVHGGFLVLGDALGRVLTPQLIHRGRMLGCLGVAVLGIHTLLGVAV